VRRANALFEFLGLNRNIGVLAATVFALGLGEELWQAYMPKYLVALGASSLAVGAFASAKDLLDSLYQYPGGWINDHLGRKRALMLFTALAAMGYAVYSLAPNWIVLFPGLLLVMSWKSGAFPTTFGVIGDALPAGKRAIAFSVQSILVRVPRVIAAPIGGLLIASLGVIYGIKTALSVTLVFALIAFAVQQSVYRESKVRESMTAKQTPTQIWAQMPVRLKTLLLADILARVGEGIAAAFIVLYVTGQLNFSAPAYGALYAIQQAVSILLYLPMGKLAEATGRRPLVALTFLFFALFPVAVRFASSFPALVGAFVLGGLKEMGEPARKSLIVDWAEESVRGRMVGVYYGIRNLLVVPAGLLGGWLFSRSPELPLEMAGAVGILGVAVYLLTTRGEGKNEMDHA
jgi:MFS family permease